MLGEETDVCVFTEVCDSRLPLHAPGSSPTFFCSARWDAQFTHNPQTHTEADAQIPDVFLHSFGTDHWRSWSTVAQREINKLTNKMPHSH